MKYWKSWEKNNFQPRILYSAKLSFRNEGVIKTFHDRQTMKEFITTTQALQEMLRGACNRSRRMLTTILKVSQRTDLHTSAGTHKRKRRKREWFTLYFHFFFLELIYYMWLVKDVPPALIRATVLFILLIGFEIRIT